VQQHSCLYVRASYKQIFIHYVLFSEEEEEEEGEDSEEEDIYLAQMTMTITTEHGVRLPEKKTSRSTWPPEHIQFLDCHENYKCKYTLLLNMLLDSTKKQIKRIRLVYHCSSSVLFLKLN